MIFIVKCVTTRFFIVYTALWWKAWFLLFSRPLKLYLILYSTGTVFFHCCIVYWRLG